MGILSLFLNRPPKYKDDLALEDEVVVKSSTYFSPMWQNYLSLPARAKIVRIWGHDIYDVEFLNHPELRGHTFCVSRDSLVTVDKYSERSFQMKTTRTTVVLPDVVLEHIKTNLDEDDTISAFLERAAVNQLEKEFSDFEVRDLLESEHEEVS